MSDEGKEHKPETLVNLSFRFPNLDSQALAKHLSPLVREALKLGGITFNFSMQPYDPDEADEL